MKHRSIIGLRNEKLGGWMLSSLASNFPQPSVGIQTEYLGHSQRGKDTWTIMDWLMEC